MPNLGDVAHFFHFSDLFGLSGSSGLSGLSGSFSLSGYLVEYANDWGNLHEIRTCTGTKEESYHMVVE